MFTLVVTPEGSFSLSAIAETKAAFNTTPCVHVFAILSESLPRWATAIRDYKQVLYDFQSRFH